VIDFTVIEVHVAGNAVAGLDRAACREGPEWIAGLVDRVRGFADATIPVATATDLARISRSTSDERSMCLPTSYGQSSDWTPTSAYPSWSAECSLRSQKRVAPCDERTRPRGTRRRRTTTSWLGRRGFQRRIAGSDDEHRSRPIRDASVGHGADSLDCGLDDISWV
jgi:hypothetical protein